MKVIVKEREIRNQIEMFSIEEFVSAEHLLRKIDSAIDFTHISVSYTHLTLPTKA